MANFLEAESFGANIKDARRAVKYLMPALKETLARLDRVGYEKLMSKNLSRVTDRAAAKMLVETKAAKDRGMELLKLLSRFQ